VAAPSARALAEPWPAFPSPQPAVASSSAPLAAPESAAVPSPTAAERAVPGPQPVAAAVHPAPSTAPVAVTGTQAFQPPQPPSGSAGPPAIRLESGGPPGHAAGQLTPETPGRQPGSLAARNAVREVADPVAHSARLATAATGSTGPGLQNQAPVKTHGPRVQVVPEPAACVIPSPQGLPQERAWLRRTMSHQHDAAASLVGRVLAENPGIRGQDGTPAADLLTDLAALRVYLSGNAQTLDNAIRTAKAGPHVPYGRCVAAGLRRMPSYRGATRLRATLADPEWKWYQNRDVVTEWAFCPAVTSGRLALPGTVEFRIWSATARRTELLEPSLPGQVIFLPGTSFKVLQVGDSEHREVLLRELSAHEIGSDGRVELGRVPLDEVALTGLEQKAAAWQAEESSENLPAGYEYRFGNPPGLIIKLGASTADPAAQDRASTP
jgi:hypothetical protein